MNYVIREVEWRLPTEEELSKMYVNLHKKGSGNFANEYYWSSSENGSNNAWTQAFYNGYQFYDGKLINNRVRAVRVFESDLTNHYKIGQELTDGFVFDIQGTKIFVCKKQDEEGTYTWNAAMKLFKEKDNGLCDHKGGTMKVKEILECKDTFNNKKLTIIIKSDEIGSGKTVAGHYLYKLLRDSGAFVRVIEKGDVVSNSVIMENLSMCNNLGDYTGKLFDIVIED